MSQPRRVIRRVAPLLRRKRNIWYPDLSMFRPGRRVAAPGRIGVGRALFQAGLAYPPGPSPGRAAETTNAPYTKEKCAGQSRPGPLLRAGNAGRLPIFSRYFAMMRGRRENRARQGICPIFHEIAPRCVAFLAKRRHKGASPTPYPESDHGNSSRTFPRESRSVPFFPGCGPAT